MRYMFDELQNAFQPLHEPPAADSPPTFIGRKAESLLTINEEEGFIEHNDCRYLRQTEVVGVREDGPSAWGVTIPLKKNTLYRYGLDPRGWWLTSGDTILSITQVGTQLDVIEIGEDDDIVWTRYYSEDLDA